MNASHDYVAYVGLDWADQTHQVCCRVAGAAQDEDTTLAHTPAALHGWAEQLLARFPQRRIAVAVEQSSGPLIYALSGHAHLVIFPVNPAMLAKYRSAAKSASGVKNDALDARLLCELVRLHPDWLRPLPVEAAPIRELRLLLEARRGLIDQRTNLSNQLTAALKSYYPQALDLIGDKPASALACAFLRRWPTLAQVQRARTQSLRRFYYQHQVRSAAKLDQRLQLVRAAVALTADQAVLATAPVLVAALVAQIEVLLAVIADYDQRISARFDAQPDAALFASLPGAGAQLAPRLLVAFGSDRARYASALQLQCYSGIAPVQVQSGGTCLTHWRWHCPRFLRQTFHEFAGCSIPRSLWAKAYYEQQIEAGKSLHQARRALAFKWQRILFRCWQNHEPYDESRYLAALRQHGSPLIARIDRALKPAA